MKRIWPSAEIESNGGTDGGCFATVTVCAQATQSVRWCDCVMKPRITNQGSLHQTGTDWSKNAADGIAEAVKEGCKRSWRQLLAPALPHEKENPSHVDWRLTIGLAGIQSMIVDGELPFDSIKRRGRAAHHSLCRSGDQRLPGLVAGSCRGSAGAGRGGCHGMRAWRMAIPCSRDSGTMTYFAGLAWTGGCLAQLVRPSVINALRAGDPVHPSIRDSAISLVVKTTILPDAELGEIAAGRCRTLPLDSEAFAMWSARVPSG